MPYRYFPIEFSSYEDYVEYLKEKGFAIEAPEEIYITYKGYGVFDDDAATERTSDSQIEYVRKDAFINKKDLVTKIEGLKRQYPEFAPTYFFNIILDLLNTTEVTEENNSYKE